jgi:choline dehydrogenase-like flavoprotein
MTQLKPRLHWRSILFHAETIATPDKLVRLSTERDRFGDPYAHIHYRSSDFDRESHMFAQELFDFLAEASGSDERILDEDPRSFYSGGHHMGGCRMGRSAQDSVADQFGRLHGTSNVFVTGGSTFVGTSGAVNPTLTMLALAFRTADFIADQFA